MCPRRKSLYEHPAENQSRMSKSHHAGEECRNRYDVGCVVSPVPDQWPRPSAVAVRRQQDRRSPCRRAGGLPQQSPVDDGSRPIPAGRRVLALLCSIPKSYRSGLTHTAGVARVGCADQAAVRCTAGAYSVLARPRPTTTGSARCLRVQQAAQPTKEMLSMPSARRSMPRRE